MEFYEFMFKYGSTTLAVIICILNLTEVVIILKKSKGRQRGRRSKISIPNIFLLSLAVSDIFVGISNISIKIVSFACAERWTKVTLKIFEILLFVFLRLSLLWSVFNLMALTVDRYLAVSNPLRYRVFMTRRRAYIVAMASWILSTACAGINYYVRFYTEEGGKTSWLMLPATIIPFCIAFVICHFCILGKIETQGRNMKQFLDASDRNGQLIKQIFEREKKTAKTVFTVVAAFVICWLPLAVVSLCFLGGVLVTKLVSNLVFVLAFTNSLVDPLLYFGSKKSLGRKLKGFFVSLCVSRQQGSGIRPEIKNERSLSGLSSLPSDSAISNCNNFDLNSPDSIPCNLATPSNNFNNQNVKNSISGSNQLNSHRLHPSSPHARKANKQSSEMVTQINNHPFNIQSQSAENSHSALGSSKRKTVDKNNDNGRKVVNSTTSPGNNHNNNIVNAASDPSNDVNDTAPGNSEYNYQKEASDAVDKTLKLNESAVSNSNNDRKMFNENSVFNGHNNEGFELQAVQRDENFI